MKLCLPTHNRSTFVNYPIQKKYSNTGSYYCYLFSVL